MAISIIPFQPIRFRTTDEIAEASCECSEKNFCQLVNENDDTTFQISASNEVTNNSFETDFRNVDNLDGSNENVVIFGQKLRFCLETKIKED